MTADRPGFRQHRPARLSEEAAIQAGQAFFERMGERRSVRDFSSEPIPEGAIELAIRAAATAPSGAHRQPWTFVAVDEPTIKRKIRLAAEAEEQRSYGGRMSQEWLDALEPLGTDWRKPFLEDAPVLVVVFEQTTGVHGDGRLRKNFYVKESVGIACGLFVAAIAQMGLCTLTHTPSPMGFLTEILGRPKHEKPFILFPVGYAAPDAMVPDLVRKPLDEVMVWNPSPTGPAPGGGSAR